MVVWQFYKIPNTWLFLDKSAEKVSHIGIDIKQVKKNESFETKIFLKYKHINLVIFNSWIFPYFEII